MKKILLFAFLLFAGGLFAQTPYDTVNVRDPQNFVEMTSVDTAYFQLIGRKANLNRRMSLTTLKNWILSGVSGIDSVYYVGDQLNILQGSTLWQATTGRVADSLVLSNDSLFLYENGTSVFVDLAGISADSTVFATLYALADTAAAIRGDFPSPDGNGIYDAAGTVADIEDMLVQLRSGNTFSMAHVSGTSGWEDYMDNQHNDDVFIGFFSSPDYEAAVGLAYTSFGNYNNKVIADEDEASISASNGLGGGSAYSANVLASSAGRVILSGLNAGSSWEYWFSNVSPSGVAGDTSIMAWDGGGANPIWLNISDFGGGGGGSPQTIDTFSLSGNTLSLSLSDDGVPAETVDLSAYDQTLSTSNDTLTISGGNSVKLPITELLRDSVTTTTLTINLETRYQKVVQIDMTSATNLTLTINNPTDAGVYTFHFLGVSGTDNVTWPAAFYDANNTALGTDALTAGTMYTCYYSSADAKYFCK